VLEGVEMPYVFHDTTTCYRALHIAAALAAITLIAISLLLFCAVQYTGLDTTGWTQTAWTAMEAPGK